jgi:hypothetical protein
MTRLPYLFGPVAALVLLLSLTACEAVSEWFSRDSEAYWLPLTAELRTDSSVSDASLEYTDACRQRRTLPIGERLQDSLTRDMGLVFEHVQAPRTPRAESIDGVVEVALGLKEVNLFIPRQGRPYPATVTLGAMMAYIDASGEVLYTKNLKVEVKGTVETDERTCEVLGLPALAHQAVGTLTQGLKKHLGASTRIKEAAQKRSEEHRTAARSTTPATARAPEGTRETAAARRPSPLSFRVMVRDSNEDHVLESGETFNIEIEVTNTNPEPAPQVLINLSGTPELVGQLNNPVRVGDLRPGEIKRIEIHGRAGQARVVQEAELIIALDAGASDRSLPSQKKFVVAMRPRPNESDPEDVDRLPKRARSQERRNAVGIAVGIGAFRHADVPTIQFAARDAETVAEYFRTVLGIPPGSVRLATDQYALKDDLAELFEEWLPEQVGKGSEVFVYLSGRGVLQTSTGAVSLIPYEGDPAVQQRLFSLRRLYDALARLPLQRAVLAMDLSLTEAPSGGSQPRKGPVWDAVPPALRGEKLLQIIGSHGKQKAHQYVEGRHGLFTYYLLKGLGGAADRDGNGIVAIGELCGYVHEQVLSTAQEKFQNVQEPACVPRVDSQARVANVPVTWLNGS